MIQVAAATTEALARPSVAVKQRLLWTLDGGNLDVSYRLLNEVQTDSRLGPFLGGCRESVVTFELDNSDRLFSPGDVAASIFQGKLAKEYQVGKLTYSVGIEQFGGTYEYVTAFTGYIVDIMWQPGSIVLSAVSPLMTCQAIEMPDDYTMRQHGTGGNLYGPSVIQYVTLRTILADTGVFRASSWDASFAAFDDMLETMDWTMTGTISRGSRIGTAIAAVARSCMATVVPNEDGTLRIDHEFPVSTGTLGLSYSSFGDPIDVTRASNWTMSQPLDLFASEIIVHYNGTFTSWRDYPHTTNESYTGRVPRTLACPYAAFLRQSRLIARIMYEQHVSWPMVLSFTTGPWGFVIQLNDRVRVTDPITGVARTARVTVKQMKPSMCRFEVVVDGHQTTIKDGAFASWDSTVWDAAAVAL